MRKLKTISLFLLFSKLCALTWAESPENAEHAEPPVAEMEPIRLTVAETIKRVKEQNLELMIQREGVRRALEQTYQRRAALLPQFGLRGEQTRTQVGRFGGASMGSQSLFNSFGARVEGSLSLFDAERYADFRIAQLGHAIEQFDYKVAVQDLLDQAIFAYFTHLRDLRSVEILEGNLAREEQLLDLAQQQFDAGVAVKIDVTRAEVRVAAAKRSLMEDRTRADDSLLRLKTLLDLKLQHPLRFERSIVDGIKSPPALKRYGQMVDLTETRPELLRQERQLDQARLAKRAVTWQRLPRVELFADWGYDSAEPLDGDEEEAWLLGVRATMPIWEGGRISAERREAQAAVRQSFHASKQLRNEIEREFEFALLDMESRYEQIEFARDEMRLGMDEVKQARERYREGLADNRELIDAQQNLADAELSHLRAIYLYGLSRLAFARSIGAVERVLE
jgi:outer membrane protein TolC